MSGSLTVIGGYNTTHGLTGLVTVPSGFTGAVITDLQSLLTSASGAVTTNAANFENLNVAGESGLVSANMGSFGAGVLVVSNTDSVNTTTAGAANISLTVPAGYNTLVVQAPGNETITGNGGSFFDVFGSQSKVDFNAAGGSGSVYASGNDTVALSGATSYFIGGSGGGNSVNASGSEVAITLAGAGNSVASSAQNASIVSAGSSDVINTTGTGTNANITVTGNASILDNAASETISASGTGKFIAYFNGSTGGAMEFINVGSAPSSIIASLNLATGAISSQGSVTVLSGAAGGVYDGGTSGNSYLVGSTGAVTLFSAGSNNFLYTDGAPTGSNYNLLNAYSGGNDTLIAGSGSTNNVFFAGTGTELILSSGSGTQNFFVGTFGSETISGSTIAGATNAFIFQQAASQGGGTDVLLNFKPGEGYINLGDGIKNVTVSGFSSLTGAQNGTEIDLSNGTKIKLFGVSDSAFNSSIVGGTHF